MSDEQDDGGSAFPCSEVPLTADEKGMSLRDWFAGQALVGLITRAVTLPPIPIKQRAVDAYKYADAMLEARKR